MKKFMDNDFLLTSNTATLLYNNYAKDMPIFDFHNHLSPKEIYENRNYSSITELWLSGDHYKWRAMRAAGVDEQYITGDADPHSKFQKWAQTVERLPGSPLYHWAHLELKRYFGIDEALSSANASEIFHRCNKMLATPEFSPVNLLKMANVAVLCTTDDPFDSLEWHLKIKNADIPFKVLPTFRPDKILHISDKNWPSHVKKLSDSSNHPIACFNGLKSALTDALVRFKSVGCVASDHGFELFRYRSDSLNTGGAEDAYKKAMEGSPLTEADIEAFESHIMHFLGTLYADLNITMQMHLGAARNFNTKVFNALGPDTGIDSVGVATDPFKLGRFLDDLNTKNSLPRTILFCLNPADNPVLTSLAINFCGSGTPGKVQTGSAWWFNDTLQGIRAQLTEAALAGLLTASVGMLTDSRSISSFVRHEYYRRILCDLLGSFVENGEYPSDPAALETLGNMVKDISYRNAENYFI